MACSRGSDKENDHIPFHVFGDMPVVASQFVDAVNLHAGVPVMARDSGVLIVVIFGCVAV